MSVTGFNRARARLAAEHKKRVESQKVSKPKIIKVTAGTNIDKAVKELTRPSEAIIFREPEITYEDLDNTEISGEPEIVETELELEPLPEVTKENNDELKTYKPKRKIKKKSKKG